MPHAVSDDISKPAGGRSGSRVVPLEPSHAAAWRPLYRAYAAFYKMPMDEEILTRTWTWLMDQQARRLEGLAAFARDGSLAGLAHFRETPDPLLGRETGFLDDLFVDPQARGQGLAGQLMAAVQTIAGERGWAQLQLMTATDNHAARALYDKVGRAAAWVTYEIPVIPPGKA